MNVYHAVAVARANLPRLTLAQRVVDKIVKNALVYETETGEALIGCAVKVLGHPEPDLYVLDTIPPDDTAVRRGAYFEQGDTLQSFIIEWWFDNWSLYREQRRASFGNALSAKWDVPLAHLGDWHKHPGTLVEPSWGDTDTARHTIFDDENKMPQLLALLATVWGRRSADLETNDSDNEHAKPIHVPVDADNVVRIDCWYMSRLTRRFVRLTPQIAPDSTLPSLPIIAWHLAQPDRMTRELEALERAGYATTSLDLYEANNTPPEEICLTIQNPSSRYVYIVETEADYPASMPVIRSIPVESVNQLPGDLTGYQRFTSLWEKSEILPKADYPAWTPDKMIIDLVRAVEAKLTEGSAAKK